MRSAKWDYPHHLLLSCLPPLPTEVRHMPRKCDEDTCLAALKLFLSQPYCLLVRRHGDPFTPEPQSLTPITTYCTLCSWLWSFPLISFHLPSQPFSIPRKCLAREGHSVVINFFFNESSVISRSEDWGRREKSRTVIRLPSYPLESLHLPHTVTSLQTKFLPNSSFFLLWCLPKQFIYSSFLTVIERIHE